MIAMRDEDLIVDQVHLGSSVNNGNHLCIQVRRLTDGFGVHLFVNHRVTTGPKRYRGKRSYRSFVRYVMTEEQARQVANAAWRAAVANGTESSMVRPALAAAHREARRLGLEARP